MPTPPSPHDGAAGDELIPGQLDLDLAWAPVPRAVAEADRLLVLLADTTDDPFDALTASAALAALRAAHPPYRPSPPADTPLRGQPLLDEALNALISAVEQAPDAAARLRAHAAITELTTPMTVPGGQPPASTGAAGRSQL